MSSFAHKNTNLKHGNALRKNFSNTKIKGRNKKAYKKIKVDIQSELYSTDTIRNEHYVQFFFLS